MTPCLLVDVIINQSLGTVFMILKTYRDFIIQPCNQSANFPQKTIE